MGLKDLELGCLKGGLGSGFRGLVLTGCVEVSAEGRFAGFRGHAKKIGEKYDSHCTDSCKKRLLCRSRTKAPCILGNTSTIIRMTPPQGAALCRNPPCQT